MHPLINDVLQRQQREGFPDLAGTIVTATIPIADRLINEVIAKALPPDGKVREVVVQALDGNRVMIKARLGGSSLFPAIPVTLAIERQPELPARPTLELRLAQSSGLIARAAAALPSMITLPPGISIDGERILVDLRPAIAERGLEAWLPYLTELRVTTRPGTVLLEVRADVRGGPTS